MGASIGSVTMSLKKLRKTNLIKYKNTGIRNTYKYMIEPEKNEAQKEVERLRKKKREKKNQEGEPEDDVQKRDER